MSPAQIAIVVAFFLPSYEACHAPDVPASPDSLAEFAFGGLSPFTAFVALYLLLVLDILSTIRGLVRGRAPRRSNLWWLLLVPGASLPVVATMLIGETSKLLFLIALLVCVGLVPYHLVRSLKLRGYRSLLHAGLASSLACAPLGLVHLQMWIRFGDDFSGAVLHVGATFVALVVGYFALAAGASKSTFYARDLVDVRARRPRRTGSKRPRRVGSPPKFPEAPRTPDRDTNEEEVHVEASASDEASDLEREPPRKARRD